MGYEDRFYVEANIVGYTGKYDNQPTVYFETFENDPNVGEVGRITLQYDLTDNIGREVVVKKNGYKRGTDYTGKLVEYNNGAIMHESRHKFKVADRSDFVVMLFLKESIIKCENQKPISKKLQAIDSRLDELLAETAELQQQMLRNLGQTQTPGGSEEKK